MPVLPFGSWPSPVTPELLGAARVSRSCLQVVGDQAFWLASDPSAGGVQGVRRVDLRQWATRGRPAVQRLGPPGLDCRSRVHEYGGGALAVWPGGLAVVERASGRVAALEGPGARQVRWLTPPAPEEERWSYGDLWPVPGGAWLLAVRERTELGSGTGRDEIVAVPLAGGPPVVLAEGRSFYAAPRVDPEGRWLAFVCWDPPNMPWDDTELWVLPLALPGGPGSSEPPRLVAGGPGEAVSQPLWVGSTLWFVSDREGFHEPWCLCPGEWSPRRPVPLGADCQGPAWTLGQRTLAPLGADRLVCPVRTATGDTLAVLHPAEGRVEPLDTPLVQIAELATWGEALVALGAGAEEPAGVVLVHGGEARWCRQDAAVAPPWPAPVSRAEPASFEAPDGFVGHLLLFRPRSTWAQGPAEARPPLLVLCHGGPTGAAEAGFDPVVQFWTTRGFLVAAVDYRGSSGFGRRYRQALEGRWGEADAEDVVAAARQLVAGGEVDPRRLALRGSSAGGLTALAATRSGVFHAAVVSYGVTDLVALRQETHRFEAHYLDRLVGPWPAAARRYEERSPARQPERLQAAVLLLQGTEDPVVPPGQAVAMAESLARAGRRCELLFLPGEGHGFRRATSVQAAVRAEERFLRSVLGLAGGACRTARASDP